MVQSWHDAPPWTKRIEPFSPVLLPADDIFLISMADYLSRESKIEFSGLAKLPPERDQAMQRLAEFCTADFVKL